MNRSTNRVCTYRKGPVKGAKDVGLGEKSRPKFKRNPHKARAKNTKEKVLAKEKSGKSESGVAERAEAVMAGSKRRGQAGRQEGALKGDLLPSGKEGRKVCVCL